MVGPVMEKHFPKLGSSTELLRSKPNWAASGKEGIGASTHMLHHSIL